MNEQNSEVTTLRNTVKFLGRSMLFFAGLSIVVIIVSCFMLERSYKSIIEKSYGRGYEAGLKSARQQAADVIVVDCMTHLMDGDQTLHSLRAAHPECEQVYLDHRAELETAIGESL